MIAALIITLYALVTMCTARRLFARMRPSRAVVQCTSSCEQARAGRYKPQDSHENRCYRQYRADLTRWPYDRDSHAAWAALGLGFVWPMGLIYLTVVAKPPETSSERKRRLAREARKAEKARQALSDAIATLEDFNEIRRYHQKENS